MKIVYMLRFLLLLVALSQVFAQKCEGKLCLKNTKRNYLLTKNYNFSATNIICKKKICVNMFHKLGQWFKLKI